MTSKIDAILDLSREFGNHTPTTTSFKRCLKAAKTLGFSKYETLRLLAVLEFCDREGNAFKDWTKPLMQQFMDKEWTTDGVNSPFANLTLERIEQKIDRLLAPRSIATAYVGWSDVNLKTLLNALREKSRIKAVKEVRAILGTGLKEAIDFCDQHFFNPE